MNQLNGGELAANAHRALECYKIQERELEAQAMAIQIHLQLVREFIAALTAAPRPSRKPRVVEGQAIDPPEPPPIASSDGAQADMDLVG
jgi:hypothetical protein